MKNYVALYKPGFGDDFNPGTRVGVPENDADKAEVAADLKARPSSKIRYASSIGEAKEKLLAWVRSYRQARGGEYKLVNEDTGQVIEAEIEAAKKAAAKNAKG
jgi:hypothetical protein